jgi:ATP-dependent RNA helicase DeaD
LTTFKSLGISPDFVKGLSELGIQNPTEIQELAIPYLLKHKGDFIGQAQTGTGKTAAFGLPLLNRVDPTDRNVQALILCPTRELGQQIAKQLFKYTKYTAKIFTEAVYGGEKIDRQIDALRRPTQIVVATPGRLIDLMNRKAVDLRNVSTVVLDEADEMLSMGFKKELDIILEVTANESNTWLFSATIPKAIQQIIHTYMSPDAFRIEVNRKQLVNPSILHQYAICEKTQKFEALTYFLLAHKNERGIIFCKTKVTTQTLTRQLQAKNYSVDCIHGDMTQKEREKAMRAFRNEKLNVLIATDITARGIDVNNLAYVFHYQLPDQIDYYTHRSGRTARAGKKGVSIALITPTEVKRIKEIGKELNIEFKRLQ